MSKTTRLIRAGLAVVYHDDAQGRRLTLAAAGRHDMLETVAVLGTTKAEARAVVTAIKDMLDELPEEEA